MRWGLLGASRILQRSLLPAMRAAGQPVTALAARDPGRARTLAAEWGIPAGYGYDALLSRDDVDAVYISTVNDAHAPWTIRALEAGKHVLCEKPLALNPGEVRTVQVAEAAAGRMVMEAFVYGFHPQIVDVLQTVRSGAIGRVVSMDAQFAGPLRDAGDYRWHARHGGGALLDLGTYCVSLIRDVMGREPDGSAGFPVMRGDVDAAFGGVLRFGDAIATFGCTFDGERAQSCRVVGTTGVIEIATPFSSKNRVLATTVNGAVRDWPACDPYAAMVAHFADAVAGRETLRHGTGEALRQARVLDALAGSA